MAGGVAGEVTPAEVDDAYLTNHVQGNLRFQGKRWRVTLADVLGVEPAKHWERGRPVSGSQVDAQYRPGGRLGGVRVVFGGVFCRHVEQES